MDYNDYEMWAMNEFLKAGWGKHKWFVNWSYTDFVEKISDNIDRYERNCIRMQLYAEMIGLLDLGNKKIRTKRILI